MTIDLQRARADTPGVTRRTHFNNAGAALPTTAVVDTVISHLSLEAELGGYEAAAREGLRVERVYDSVATLLGCARDEVALVESATAAWNLAFHSLRFVPGDVILTSESEYASNYISLLHSAVRAGARVEVVPSDASGALSIPELERRMGPEVKLIALTYLPSNGGLVNPAADVGRVARAAGVPYLLDACQAAGQLPLDVEALRCDFLAATGRKFLRAPRGTGFLYVRREWIERLDPPMPDLLAATWKGPGEYELRKDARRFETWERSVAGQLGLGAAVDYALAWGLPDIWARVQALAEKLRGLLRAVPGCEVCDLGEVRSGIVTFRLAGQSADAVRRALAVRNINVWVSRRSSTLLDMSRRGLEELIRASVHYYNSEEELELLVAALPRG